MEAELKLTRAHGVMQETGRERKRDAWRRFRDRHRRVPERPDPPAPGIRPNLKVQIGPDRWVGYSEIGSPKGEPIVFLHGWPGSRMQSMWLETEARRRNLRILAPERPGVGLSTYQPSRRLWHWPETLNRFADAVGLDRFSVLGLSGGSPYALISAARLKDRIKNIGVCCPAPPLKGLRNKRDLVSAYRLLINLHNLTPGSMPLIFRLLRAWVMWMPEDVFVRPCLWILPERDRQALRHPLNDSILGVNVREAFRQSPRAIITDARIYLKRWGFSLDEIPHHVRFWHGDKDANFPLRMVRRMTSQIPRHSLKTVPNEGHFSLPLFHGSMLLDELTGEA